MADQQFDTSHANQSFDGAEFAGVRGFQGYRRQAIARAREILDIGRPGEFDEQALPAYTHRNVLMRWLFWRRLARVVKYFDHNVPKGANVLDFGCGVGVLLPLLAARGHTLTGVDVDLRFAPRFLTSFGVQGVTLQPADRLKELAPASYDVVTALDVLEHVDDLTKTVADLGTLLKPGGTILVCGPTENLLYRAGRWLAGFSGDYHVRDISDIRKAFDGHFSTQTVATLFPIVPFFRVFAARPSNAA